MKKSILYLFSAIMLVAVGCSESYDDSALVGRVDKLENRVAQLEELCRQMNTNISSLQTIVNALENKDYVTGVTPITKGGETIGYTITFTKSQPITIYHGEDGKDGQNGTDGKDGHTPIIGVKQDTDGIYYWTLDGEWLLDDNGNKIKAQGLDGKDGKDGADGTDGTDGKDGKDGENGTNGKDGSDGKDGITPQLKIENDYWYISYDNGSTWTQLGRAKGEDGANGTNGENGKNGDSFFQSVDTSNSDYVIFTLADGTKLSLPRHKNLSISFDIADGAACMPSASIKVGYTLTGADSGTTIETIGDGGWKSTVTKTNVSSGYITVTAPESGGDGKVVMLATTSTGFTAMKAITFEEGVVMNVSDAYQASYENSTLKITLRTNLKYTVNIPDNAKSWISVADTRATVRTETLTFTIQENPEENPARSATIRLIGECGDVLQSFVIMQDYQPSSSPIVFADANVKKVCVEKFDTNGDGELSEKEASVVTSIGQDFFGDYESLVKSFDELKYFVNLKEITWDAFHGCYSLSSIYIPSGITSIQGYTFQHCASLNSVNIPDGVTEIGGYAFHNCTALTSINIPESCMTIGERAFAGCTSLTAFYGKFSSDDHRCLIKDGVLFAFAANGLTEYTIPSNVNTIDQAFYECRLLEQVIIPNSVTSIGDYAFWECKSLRNITIPDTVNSIGHASFYGCELLTDILICGVSTIGDSAFSQCYSLTNVTIGNNISVIAKEVFWNCGSLTNLYCKATSAPTLGPNVFYLAIPKGNIYVPTESVEAYQNSSGWKDYADIIKGYDFNNN